MVSSYNFQQINPYLYEFPQSYRGDMRVPARFYSNPELLKGLLTDKSLEQLVNTATLPGVVNYALAMPDIHQGYGFPIGGVIATELPDGIISPGGVGYDINCLGGDSRILHEHGYHLPISQMGTTWQSDTVRCRHFDAGREETTSVVRYFRQRPKRPVYRLVTTGGDEIVATADHPFWTPRGMVPLEELSPGEFVARTALEGVPYEPPPAAILVDEGDIERGLAAQYKGKSGNALGQITGQLRRRGLLPLRPDSRQFPPLVKLFGYLLGDGTVYFSGKSGKGTAWFYGEAADLEEIRQAVKAAGFKPSRLYTRNRQHRIQTAYNDYNFERQEASFKVVSSAFVALIAALGMPLGAKASQDYRVPAWLYTLPLWQQRLFLASLFGAELPSPTIFREHNHNFQTPTLSLNKREQHLASGRAFLEDVGRLLEGFGVTVKMISQRAEQINGDGSQSYRLRLILSSQSESLLRLWGCVGYEFNHKRQAVAAMAIEYLKQKVALIRRRNEAAAKATALYAGGKLPQAIYEEFADAPVNRRFLERSVYQGRTTSARVGGQFETFTSFCQRAARGLEGSGMVWATVAEIEPVNPLVPDGVPDNHNDEYVYDFTVAHPDHNFIANGFVVSNCGVRLLATQIEKEAAAPYLSNLASALYDNCPGGVGRSGSVKLKGKELDKVLENGARWALQQGMASAEDLERTEENGCIAGANPDKVSARAKERGSGQLGTMGAGNHFVEVDVVDEIYDEEAAGRMGLHLGCLAVQIHTGSRGFGHQVCTDYVKSFQPAVQKYGLKLPDRELVCAPLSSPEGQDYLAAMKCAANYAFTNRQLLAYQVRRSFEQVLKGKVRHHYPYQVYDIAHNMAKVEEHDVGGRQAKVCVHRKGATRAFGPGSAVLPRVYRDIGQPVLVPGSMGTASWVLLGTQGSMEQSFGSTCHGAGRVMSRAQAKRQVRGSELREELEGSGIAVRAGSMPGLAEEAPTAYKDVDLVVEVVSGAGIAKKVARLVPVAVIKG